MGKASRTKWGRRSQWPPERRNNLRSGDAWRRIIRNARQLFETGTTEEREAMLATIEEISRRHPVKPLSEGIER